MKQAVLLVIMLFSLTVYAQEDTVNLEDALIMDTTVYGDTEFQEYDSDTEVVSESDADTDQTPKTLVEPRKLTRDYRSEPMQQKEFDTEKWKKIAGEKSFDEEPDEEKDPISFGFNQLPFNNNIAKIIAYVLIGAIIAALLFFILKNITFETKLKKKTAEPSDASAAVENIEELDIQRLLQQALAEGNYRLAIRLYYLGLLKRLNETGLIKWKKDKTNREYLTELFTRELYFDDVRKLTLAYEQVWYGEYKLTQESFNRLSANFEDVNKRLNAGQPQ